MRKTFMGVVTGITLLLFGALLSTPANATSSQDYTWVTWEIPAGTVQGTPHGAGDVGWPQHLVGVGKYTPSCGVWYQVDKYRGTEDSLSWMLLDNLLTGGPSHPEDSSVVVDWYFVYGGDCSTSTPTPTPTPTPNCPVGQVPGAPNDEGVYVCQNDNTPEPPPAPKPEPVPHQPTFTG